MKEKQLITAVEQFVEKGFWGNIQLDLQNGTVTVVRTTRTTKIPYHLENNNERNTR